MAYEWITGALETTWSALEHTLRPRDEAAYDAATPCPGWSVRDVLSHLTGFELLLQGGSVPVHEGPWPSYVKNPIGEINEAFVEAYRATSGSELLDLFCRTCALSIERLRALSDEEWEKVGWS